MRKSRADFPPESNIAKRRDFWPRLLIDLLGVGNDPIQSLFFGSKAIDATLVAFVISYNHVPTRSLLVLEGQHYWFFFRVCHALTMRSLEPGFQFDYSADGLRRLASAGWNIGADSRRSGRHAALSLFRLSIVRDRGRILAPAERPGSEIKQSIKQSIPAKGGNDV